MFERELVDTITVKRWGIVRTLQTQSIAEHMFLVSHYVNDICEFLEIPACLHLACMKYAIWHDVDEVFSGDAPGPNKRGLLDAMGPGARQAWDAKLDEWADKVFENRANRMGLGHLGANDTLIAKLIIKTADWLEASVRMATEHQMGNGCAYRHIEPNKIGATETAKKLCLALGKADEVSLKLAWEIETCVSLAENGHSRSPWITKEDEGRLGVLA